MKKQSIVIGEFYASFNQRPVGSTNIWHIYSTIAPKAIINIFAMYRRYEVIFADDRMAYRFYKDAL